MFSTFKKTVKLALSALALLALFAAAQPATASAGASPVGLTDYGKLVQQHPDTAQAEEAFKGATKQAQDDFNAKAAALSPADKQAAYQQTQRALQEKRQELFKPIFVKIDAAVKEVVEAKGLTVVLDKSVIVYGGQDITADVLKKITGK